MALTEKDVDFEFKTGHNVLDNVGKFDVNALKYKVNTNGRPVLYTKGHGKSDQSVTFQSMLNMWETLAKRKGEEAAEKIRQAAEVDSQKAKNQTYTAEMKMWRDFLKSILARGTVAKKEFEEKLKQKGIDASTKDWYTDVGAMFD